MSSIIQFDHVHYKYPGDDQESLCGISLSIEEGSFVAVLGRNGSGKSSVAKHMNAILVPDSGKVTVCGMDTADESNLLNIRKNVGMVFQNRRKWHVVTPSQLESSINIKAVVNLACPKNKRNAG